LFHHRSDDRSNCGNAPGYSGDLPVSKVLYGLFYWLGSSAKRTIMTKTDILDLIRRMATLNGGKAPGSQLFASETGLRKSDWYPKLWVRWGDAVREAGLQPNSFVVAPPEEELICRYITLIRKLGRFPIESDLRLTPNLRGLARLGNKRERARKVLDYCRSRIGFEDVIPTCEAIISVDKRPAESMSSTSSRGLGYVYLLKHGSRAEYKIGRTTNLLRRQGEIGIELPEEVHPVHSIQTDDPSGIEAYWHRRFANRRKRGEWFDLTLDDVQAFKRWKRIY
jgi:hypothetical protein